MGDTMMPAVLLGGSANALSVARSLWSSGVSVDALADGRARSAVRHSRACQRYVTPSDSERVAEEWLTWLLKESPPAVLLACCDEGIEFIARHRAELESAGHRAVEADDRASLNMLDKANAYDLARKADVPAPRTVTVTSMSEFAELDFAYPCGIKPLHSHIFARNFKTAAKGVTVATPEQARRILAPIFQVECPMLVTEVIPGPDDRYRSYYTYIDEQGEPLVNFTKRKLRQYPTHFGLGTYHLTEWNPEVARLGLRFARAAGLRGLVNVEFKQDVRDDRLKLIECNPRFTEVNEQVRASGIDLALLAYNRLVGLPLPKVDSFRDHLGIWFPVNDLRALREYRRQGELTTAAWLRTLARRQAPVMFSWRDPKPSLIAWRGQAFALAGKLLPWPGSEPTHPADGARDPYDAG